MAEFTIRRITTNDAVPLAALRLRALADSPSAFGSTLEREQEYGPELWQERCDDHQAGNDQATFLGHLASVDQEADPAAAPVGMVCMIPGDIAGEGELVSMFTAPEGRGLGLGVALVEACKAWTIEAGQYRSIKLWVTRGNTPAEKLYEKLGFVHTGEEAPLPSDPCKDEVRMIWTVPTVRG